MLLWGNPNSTICYICDGVTHRINDAAQPLENEHRRPVVVQIVPLRRLYADGHEGFGFRLGTCEAHTLQ